jgi:hypothetical protein
VVYIINVIDDYGADPSNVADSSTAFQAAFDAAFGSSASPHGLANATSNRPVFIPNGSYKLNSSLNLTRVVGGYIFGAGPGATILNGSSGAVFNINGAANLIIERLNITCGSQSSGHIGVDLNWDNTSGGDGLHNNVFRDLLITTCNTGIRIAQGGFGGSDNLFQNVTISSMAVGIDAQSTTAVNNTVISGGGGSYTAQLYLSSLGSIHVFEPSIGANSNAGAYGVQVDSGLPVCVIAGRGESCDKFLKLTSGLVTVRAVDMAAGTEFAHITGGKITLDACLISNGGLGQINGTGGTLYIRGCSGLDASSITAYAGGGGTVAQNI